MPNNEISTASEINRAAETRRDNDTQKSISISLYDIDNTILNHLKNNLKLQVEHEGVIKKPTCMFGSPELWKAMQSDSFIRDYQGKITLPSIVLKRTTSDSDEKFIHFNRYLSETVIKTYSEKNQYTRFSQLNGSNAPVNEIYNITFPSHMKLTYKFIIWTEYISQMNQLVEAFQFNTKDYWGTEKGYKFRVDSISFGHTVELQSGDDRLVKTEFDLNVHGYILPETSTMLDSQKSTFKKFLSPKKIVMGVELSSTGQLLNKYGNNNSKWKNQQYPNKDADDIITPPPITVSDGVVDPETGIISNSNPVFSTLSYVSSIGNTNITNIYPNVAGPYLTLVETPSSTTSVGQEGQASYDDQYFYIYTKSQWRRVAISNFS